MAITSSAKKAYRQSLHKKVFNTRRSRTMKIAVADFKRALAAKEKTIAGQLPDLYQAIDKAVKRGIIKKNTASRMKSRLSKKLSTAVK